MSLSYIVFCRIVGIKELPDDELSAAVGVLADVVKEACAAAGQAEPAGIYSSVYGRLLVISWHISAALDVARSIRTRAQEGGVRLAIGIASGRVVQTHDVPGENVAGVAINRAARLAHLDGGEGQIAVEEDAVSDALKSAREYATRFGREPLQGRVKNTELEYRWLQVEQENLKEVRKRTRAPNPTSAHVVVYDIAGFSKMHIEELRKAVGHMQDAVHGAFHSVGVDDARKPGDRFWYAPAGDGGVVVFRQFEVAWAFAKEFQHRAEGNVEARVGVATGNVVVVDDLPVGSAIMEADGLSGLPASGGICVSDRFWEQLGSTDRKGWTAEPHATHSKALLLHQVVRWSPEPTAAEPRPGSQTPVPRQPASRSSGRCILVVLSDAERTAKYTLKTAVTSAVDLLNAKEPFAFAPIKFLPATDAISSAEAFSQVTRDLCAAEVVVFDVTGYEPAVMLLAGIRAVVRRGVTILSLGGQLSLQSIDELPFNIKDANLVSHAEGQQKNIYRPPQERVRRRIQEGLRQVSSPGYLDLPAYEAVRNLPANERWTIPADECVLALVSFGEEYVNKNWDSVLRPALSHHQGVLRQKAVSGPQLADHEPRPARYGVVRSVDIDSPRLVSSAIYGLIRRTALCVVDWTDWRANVFFELGVRLAASPHPVVCLIDDEQLAIVDGKQPIRKGPGRRQKRANLEDVNKRLDTISVQARALASLLACKPYSSGQQDTWEAFAWIFGTITPVPAIEACRAAICSSIDTTTEPAAVPIYRELLWSALRFATDESTPVSCVLYENEKLEALARDALRDRMIAAWTQFQVAKFMPEQILHDQQLWDEWSTIVHYVSAYLKEREPAQFERIKELQKAKNQLRKQGKQ
jgi:hypothetical protein